MTLTHEYQYIGRSNAVKDQNNYHSYYILLYAKTSGSIRTGQHTVTIKSKLVTETNYFYGFQTKGSLTIDGTTVNEWNSDRVPEADWPKGTLTEGGITYNRGVDLREASLNIDVGYGVAEDIVIGASWAFVSGTESWLPQPNVTASVSATVTLPMIAGASEPSVSASSVELNKEVVIYTNRIKGSGFTHKLTYQFKDVSGTIAEGVEDSYTWKPQGALALQIPNTVSGQAVITCTTYAGNTVIGTKQVALTLKVPETFKPNLEVTLTDVSGVYTKTQMYVQNVSKLDVAVTGTGSAGSTIIGSSVTLNGKAYSGGVLTESGHFDLVASVTDSRGRTNTSTYVLNVVAYTVPWLTIRASRCTADGTADEAGDHAKITVKCYIALINGRNKGTLSLSLPEREDGTDIAFSSTFVTEEYTYEQIVYADPNNIQPISAELSDLLLTVSRTMTLSTGYATMDLLAGGKGISFGKAATREGFECAMPAYFTGGVTGVGHGLGETAWLSAVPDTGGGTGFYSLEAGATDSPFVSIGDIVHIGRTANIATQLGIEHQYGRPDLIVRKRTASGWGDWRHINPRMLLNTEYLTNEVWQSKDVYVKALNFETLASSGYAWVELGMNVTPITIHGITYNSQYICDLSALRDVDEVFYQTSNGRLMIHSASAGAADYKAIVVVEYTKG